MRIVTLRLDLDRDVRSSSIVEAVIYELIDIATQETTDYLQIREIKCGDAVATFDPEAAGT